MARSVETNSDRRVKSPLLRGVFLILGFISLALVPLSYLPGIPTFDLILLSAFFFSLSSERMHDWMLNHRHFGRVIRGYRDHGLTMRMKWTAAVAIVLSLTLSGVFLVNNLWIRILLVAVGVYALWFVFTRPTWRVEG